MTVYEVNYDGLVGPTHNYSGLSWGNVASTTHASLQSRPREAALQGLAKMKALHDLGVRQAVIPPQERPLLSVLRSLGFGGADARVLERVAREEPRLLAAVSSASSMWTANAATVTPSLDAEDGKTHFTPANLVAKFHRSLEAPTTTRLLRALFPDPGCFTVHDPLPPGDWFSDEGAANHTRLGPQHGTPGVHLFVYGRSYGSPGEAGPRKFPARQTREAAEAIARRHRLPVSRTVLARQAPSMIDQGVFHNDVISVGNEGFFFYHEGAFVDEERVLEELRAKFAGLGGGELKTLCVKEAEVSTEDAVRSYLFNSQLVTTSPGKMTLIAPHECETVPSVKRYLQSVTSASSPISALRFLDLRQSMNNGGGPACLRLRVVLSERELERVHRGALFTDALYSALQDWVKKHYREQLNPSDLADPKLLQESRAALDALCAILHLPSVYEFQRASTSA